MTQDFSRRQVADGPMYAIPHEGLRKIWAWALVISLGGFLFGYGTAVISGALLFIRAEFRLDAIEQGSVVSVLLLGALVGALGIGSVSDRIGRRKTLGLEGLVFVVGTALAVFAPGYGTLLTARLIVGLAIGAVSATVPVYLSEISPTEIRGRILTLHQFQITVGILAGYLVNLVFAGNGNWRAMFAVGAIPALVMLAGAAWALPESPEWLATHGEVGKARALVASVTNEATADRLIERRRQRRERDEAQLDRRAGWRVLLTSRVRPALIVGLTLAAVQQFSGINTIIYYAPTLMQQTGLTLSNSIFYSVAIGVINLVMTIVAIRLIDQAGRRVLLTVSLAGMMITLALLGLAFATGWSPQLTLVLMVLYIVAYAVGLGPVFWALVGEIFPPTARAAGSSASTAVNMASNFVVSLVFLTVIQAIGQSRTFWIFALICALALWFVGRYVPETRDREEDEVEADLQSRFRHPPQIGTQGTG
jgi:MFS transporter, SP family, galactose:H+ symporter